MNVLTGLIVISSLGVLALAFPLAFSQSYRHHILTYRGLLFGAFGTKPTDPGKIDNQHSSSAAAAPTDGPRTPRDLLDGVYSISGYFAFFKTIRLRGWNNSRPPGDAEQIELGNQGEARARIDEEVTQEGNKLRNRLVSRFKVFLPGRVRNNGGVSEGAESANAERV